MIRVHENQSDRCASDAWIFPDILRHDRDSSDPIASTEDCSLAIPLVGRDSAIVCTVRVLPANWIAATYHSGCRQAGEDASLDATEGWCANHFGDQDVPDVDRWIQLSPSPGNYIVGVATQKRSPGSGSRVTSYLIASETSTGVWTYVQVRHPHLICIILTLFSPYHECPTAVQRRRLRLHRQH